ncbi:hypothetical protein [Aliikangiella sp. IMCC44359]|uniref:hypothetical protein n=1 Tax=Aliikangiella sp. IMCC44359 TaxID=3459125 RepID=UPI00403AE0B6
MKTQLFKLLSLTLIIVHPHLLKAVEDHGASLFASYESNGRDYISGVGASVLLKDDFTHFGAQLSTSLNYAEVTSTDGYLEDFVSWEAAIKFGYFSKLSLYGEVGIDLAEIMFYDLRYDDDYHDHYEDNVDMYVGIGAGINAGPLSIEAFSRLREIDSRYWEAESEVFSGVRFSINF